MPPRRASLTCGMRARRAAPNRCWSLRSRVPPAPGGRGYSYQCPACTMIGEGRAQLRPAPASPIQSLIPALSCPRCPGVREAHRLGGIAGSQAAPFVPWAAKPTSEISRHGALGRAKEKSRLPRECTAGMRGLVVSPISVRPLRGVNPSCSAPLAHQPAQPLGRRNFLNLGGARSTFVYSSLTASVRL